MTSSLVGSEMCIRDRVNRQVGRRLMSDPQIQQAGRSVRSTDWQIGRSDRLAGSGDRRMSANGQIRRSDRLA
eukprot:8621910-Prorocentrum_lima.AAC.1